MQRGTERFLSATDKVQLMTERFPHGAELMQRGAEQFPSATDKVPLMTGRFPNATERSMSVNRRF